MKFKTKVFIAILASLTLISIILNFVSYTSLKQSTVDEFRQRYKAHNQFIADTLSELEKTSEVISLNAAYLLYELDKAGGLLSDKKIKELKAELKVSQITITNKTGHFLRDSNKDPSVVKESLFDFCSGYRNLLDKPKSYEITPILPSVPYEGPYKFTMLSNHDNTRILEVGYHLKLIGDILLSSIKADNNIESLTLLTPSGFNLGQIYKDGRMTHGEENLFPSLEADTFRFTKESLIVVSKVKAPTSDCCECRTKKVANANGEYFYLLRTEVSNKSMLLTIKQLGKRVLSIFFLSIIAAIILSNFLSNKLVDRLQRLNKFIQHVTESQELDQKLEGFGNDEIGVLAQNFNKMVSSLESNRRNLVNSEKDKAIYKMSRQVAHDIRSPLSALEILLSMMTEIKDDKRVLLSASIKRIKEIAEDILHKTKVIKNEKINLNYLISYLVSEKRLKTINTDIKYQVEFDTSASGCFVDGVEQDILRLFSNIIDNSIDAVSVNKSPLIKMRIESIESYMCITVSDNGSGIPEEILNKIFNDGFSYNKDGGTGVGLSFVKAIVEKLNGEIEAESKVGVGTTVTVKIPVTKAPSWYIGEIDIRNCSQIVLIDDEPTTYDRLKRLELGVEITYFESYESLIDSKSDLASSFYFIDYSYRNSDKNGIEIIKSLGVSSSILITNNFDDKNLLLECDQNGIKLLPKSFLENVRVKV